MGAKAQTPRGKRMTKTDPRGPRPKQASQSKLKEDEKNTKSLELFVRAEIE